MNRDFKGVWIPKEIWLNHDLSIMEKLFLVEIDSLDGKQGCFASNAHFAEFFQISKGRCTQIIKELEAKKLINIALIREGKQIKKRIIRVVNKLNRVVNKLNNPSENTKSPYLENAQGSNTSNINTKERERSAHTSSKTYIPLDFTPTEETLIHLKRNGFNPLNTGELFYYIHKRKETQKLSPDWQADYCAWVAVQRNVYDKQNNNGKTLDNENDTTWFDGMQQNETIQVGESQQ